MCICTQVDILLNVSMFEYVLSLEHIYIRIFGNLLSFCLDVAQGHMKGAPNETRTHSCRFASRAC